MGRHIIPLPPCAKHELFALGVEFMLFGLTRACCLMCLGASHGGQMGTMDQVPQVSSRP